MLISVKIFRSNRAGMIWRLQTAVVTLSSIPLYLPIACRWDDNFHSCTFNPRCLEYLQLKQPFVWQVSKGQVVPSTQNSARKPAYDFYIGQDCIPTVAKSKFYFTWMSAQFAINRHQPNPIHTAASPRLDDQSTGGKLEQSGVRQPGREREHEEHRDQR